MNRTLILLVFFLLSAGATWYFLQEEQQIQMTTTVSSDDRRFKVDNTADIQKIFIAQRTGETVTLERKDSYWLYNEKYKALPNAIDNLMRAFREMQMQYIPPAKAVPTIIRNLATQGIKVELYDKAGEQMRAFYIGGATVDERGTYAIMDGAEQPYVIHIPTWEGNLRFRFNLRGDRWRDKSIFSEKLEDVQSIASEYPKQKNNSFKIEEVEGTYQVQPFYGITPKINRPVSQGRVEGFLTSFESVIAEAFENENPRRDSILQSVPFSIITIKNKAGVERKVQFFPIVFETSDYNAEGQPMTREQVDRYFVDVDGEDLMLAQQLVSGKVFWKYDSFFK
ncbi:MAG: DUF4340 domain-containing protein [Bacteroidota bacterium]